MKLIEEYIVVGNILTYYSRRPSRRPGGHDKYEFFWRNVRPHPHPLVRVWHGIWNWMVKIKTGLRLG